MRGGGVHGRGVCMARGGGACVVAECVSGGMYGGGVRGGGHAWQGEVHGMHAPPRQILRDMVNERVVRILLECILVLD